jgi:hypothetical protein
MVDQKIEKITNKDFHNHVIKVIYDKQWVASIRQTNNAYQIIVGKGQKKHYFRELWGSLGCKIYLFVHLFRIRLTTPSQISLDPSQRR